MGLFFFLCHCQRCGYDPWMGEPWSLALSSLSSPSIPRPSFLPTIFCILRPFFFVAFSVPPFSLLLFSRSLFYFFLCSLSFSLPTVVAHGRWSMSIQWVVGQCVQRALVCAFLLHLSCLSFHASFTLHPITTLSLFPLPLPLSTLLLPAVRSFRIFAVTRPTSHRTLSLSICNRYCSHHITSISSAYLNFYHFFIH